MGKINAMRAANLQPKDAGTDGRQFLCASSVTINSL